MNILKNSTLKIGIFSLFCTLYFATNAQLCTGTLGDPVVNVDFGRGVLSGGPSLTTTLPNLNFVLSPCPEDGRYAIQKATTNCYSGSWHNVLSNHTPNDPNGYMMVINANAVSGDFYIDTISGLCGNTTYEFAAWALNLTKDVSCGGNAINPSLTFSIETLSGTVLGSYKTGNIVGTSTPTWKQYGLFFKTPATAQTVVLRITNASPGGCGNDIALDDITFRPCGPTLSISIPGYPGNVVDECFGKLNSVTVQANLGVGYASPAVAWQQSVDSGKTWTDIPGSSGLTYSYQITAPANYKVRASVAEASNIGVKQCRISSNEVTINIRELAGYGAQVNSPVCTNDLIQFDAGEGSNFSWKGPNGFTSNIKNPSLVATLARAGTYYLDASNAFGCAGKDTLDVVVDQRPVAVVSNSVSKCENDTVLLTASGGTNFNWSPTTGLSDPSSPSQLLVLSKTVQYNVIVSNGSCADTGKITVTVSGVPKANAGPDMYIIKGQSVVLQGQAEGSNVSYTWQPGSYLSSSTSLNPVATPPNDITYQLRVSSNAGCGVAFDDVFIRVFEKLFIPNAISPNGDGINDTWRIEALVAFPKAEVLIFDRYGQIVYKAKGGYTTEWDGNKSGKPVPVGVYYYVIDLKNDSPVLKGSIVVVR